MKLGIFYWDKGQCDLKQDEVNRENVKVGQMEGGMSEVTAIPETEMSNFLTLLGASPKANF